MINVQNIVPPKKKCVYFLFILFNLACVPTNATGLENRKHDSGAVTKETPNYKLSNDTTNNPYVSYHELNLAIGKSLGKNNWEVDLINERYFFSFCYHISEFSDSLEDIENQIGLFNEFGIRNIRVYYNFGPEVRVMKKIYLMPYVGITFGFITGAIEGGLGFDGIVGSKFGFTYEIINSVSFNLELGGELSMLKKDFNNYYLKSGINVNI